MSCLFADTSNKSPFKHCQSSYSTATSYTVCIKYCRVRTSWSAYVCDVYIILRYVWYSVIYTFCFSHTYSTVWWYMYISHYIQKCCINDLFRVYDFHCCLHKTVLDFRINRECKKFQVFNFRGKFTIANLAKLKRQRN